MKKDWRTRIKSVPAAALAVLLFLALSAGCAEADYIRENATVTSGQPEAAATEEAATETSGAAGTLTVTFLDVGQGNAVLVEQDGVYMLIDGGGRDYSSFVVSYLKEQGVEEFAYVIASHYDADHLNGVVGALNAFPCDTVLAADYTTDTRVYDSFCSVVEEKDIALVYPAVGDTYTLGDAEFTIVCPDSYTYADDNDNSVGVRLTYGETSFLICGDAGKSVEAQMLESGIRVDADVYLASHHGSSGSSSLEFLQAVRPEAVVISAGAGNSYGHPTAVVLENIEKVGAALYRTDLQGTLVAVSDGSAITWNVSPCTDYRDGDTLAASEGIGTEGTGTGEIGTEGTGTEGTEYEQAEYVMNMNTKKFHLPSCESVEDISPDNKANFTGSREELIAAGYVPCKRCNP